MPGVAGDAKRTQGVPGGESWDEARVIPSIPQSAPGRSVLRLPCGPEVYAKLILESPPPVTRQVR